MGLSESNRLTARSVARAAANAPMGRRSAAMRQVFAVSTCLATILGALLLFGFLARRVSWFELAHAS